jgi:hypothetical protein
MENSEPSGDKTPVPFSSPKSVGAYHYIPKTDVEILFPEKGVGRAYQKPSTLPNVACLLNAYDITVSFNAITKDVDIEIPGYVGSKSNRVQIAMTVIESLAARHGISTTGIREVITVIAYQHTYNPVRNWIVSKPWDGTSRFDAFCDTITAAEEFPPSLKAVLLKKWLRSAVAAATMEEGFHSRGVLTLQGPQGIGKSSFLRSMVSDADLSSETVLIGYSWDGGSKDSRIAAIRHWIVELGELESSFRRELGTLKAFITQKEDKIRPPYARADIYYPRQTVFAATVNERNFLKDATGNSRFWTIPVTALNYDHGIDMQQLYAELLVELQQGEIWWLTSEEEVQLADSNLEHRDHGPTGEQVRAMLDLELKGKPDLPRMTATMVLARLGHEKPSNGQFKECHAVLREFLGEPTHSNGQSWWRVPLVIPSSTLRY